MNRLNGLTILVVEDNYLIGEDLRALLMSAGATAIGPVTSARAAIEMLVQTSIDGVLLDVDLGEGGNSADVAVELRRRCLPFVVVTGYDGSTIPSALKGGPWIQKPFQAVDLYDIVARTFRASSPA